MGYVSHGLRGSRLYASGLSRQIFGNFLKIPKVEVRTKVAQIWMAWSNSGQKLVKRVDLLSPFFHLKGFGREEKKRVWRVLRWIWMVRVTKISRYISGLLFISSLGADRCSGSPCSGKSDYYLIQCLIQCADKIWAKSNPNLRCRQIFEGFVWTKIARFCNFWIRDSTGLSQVLGQPSFQLGLSGWTRGMGAMFVGTQKKLPSGPQTPSPYPTHSLFPAAIKGVAECGIWIYSYKNN